MALLITENKTVLGNIDVSTLYLRFNVNHYDIKGDSVEIVCIPYLSPESYEANPDRNGVWINEIPRVINFPYNRESDGLDLLMFAHNKYKTILSTDIVKNVNVTDASGNIIYNQIPLLDASSNQRTDPSTGELIWVDGDPSTMEVIDIPKFANAENITFVNMDSSISS